MAGFNMEPPEEPDYVVPAHCLPVFREDGIGLMYVVDEEAEAGEAQPSDTPPAGDGTISGLVGVITDESNENSERLKRLLK